jgi:hypothetical protein
LHWLINITFKYCKTKGRGRCFSLHIYTVFIWDKITYIYCIYMRYEIDKSNSFLDLFFLVWILDRLHLVKSLDIYNFPTYISLDFSQFLKKAVVFLRKKKKLFFYNLLKVFLLIFYVNDSRISLTSEYRTSAVIS